MSTSKRNRLIKSSRDRNDNARFGFQASAFNKKGLEMGYTIVDKKVINKQGFVSRLKNVIVNAVSRGK